jgi:hypothetical protein
MAALLFTAVGSATHEPAAKATLICDKGVLQAFAGVELRVNGSPENVGSAELSCGENLSGLRDHATIVASQPFDFVLFNWLLTTDAGSRLCLSQDGTLPLEASCQVNGTGPAITVIVKQHDGPTPNSDQSDVRLADLSRRGLHPQTTCLLRELPTRQAGRASTCLMSSTFASARAARPGR